MAKKELIILCSYAYLLDCFKDKISRDAVLYRDYVYHLILTTPTEQRNISDMFQECCKLMEQRPISGVISTGCWNSLIHAALHEEYPQINGASFESEFLAMHKLYFRQVIGSWLPEWNTSFGCWNVENGRMDASNISKNKSIIIKPYLGTNSLDIYTVENQTQLNKLQNDSSLTKFNLPESAMQFIKTQLKQIKGNRYKVDTGYILEEYFDGVKEPISFHSVDFAVSKSTIVEWTINDNIYWPHRPVCFLGIGVPSRLSAGVQDEAWALMGHLKDILVKYGYDNQFLNVELIIFRDGKIKIMEINGRIGIAAQLLSMYDGVLDNGDLIKAATDLSLGYPLKSPKIKPGTYGLNAYINVFTSGRAGDLIDFPEARKLNEICLNSNEDKVIHHNKSSVTGQKLGYVITSGTSFEDCLNKTREIIGKVISAEAQRACPWFENVRPNSEK